VLNRTVRVGVTLQDSQCRQTLKCVHEPRTTRNQLLCWRGLAIIEPKDPTVQTHIIHMDPEIEETLVGFKSVESIGEVS
jgi:hypothetical protein